MHQYSTSKRLIAGILLVSHGLMSCSNFDVNKQEFEDTTTKLAIEASNTHSTISSGKEEEEAALPTLSEASNENTISSPSPSHAAINNPAVEEANSTDIPGSKKEINSPVVLLGKQAPSSKPSSWVRVTSPSVQSSSAPEKHVDLGNRPVEKAVPTPIPTDIPEGKKEINPPVMLLGKQAPGSKPRPWIQPSRGISVTSDNNNTSSNKVQETAKPANNPSTPAVTQEIDMDRMELATAILSNTGAEPDVRLHTYYRLLKQLDKHLQADKVLEGGWNLLWQKAQEPELLVDKDTYYKQLDSQLEGREEAFKELQEAIKEIQLFKAKLGAYGEVGLACQRELDGLVTFYEQFKEKLLEASLGVQDLLELSKLLEPKALMICEWWPEDYYRLDQSMARHLLRKNASGNRKEGEQKEATSNHAVSFLPQGSPLLAEVYFKNEGMPHLNPSREYMLYSLYKRLGIAVPASGMLVIDHVKFGEKYNEEPFCLQASTAIPGTLAKGPLKDNLKLDLDIAHFSKQVLGALLSGPVDGKADNYVLIDLPNKKQGLVSIDNDEVFQSPMKGERVHLKSVLFFLASMKEVISKGVDVLLRQLPISWLILEWLSSMQGQEERYQLLQDNLVKHVTNNKLPRKGGKLTSNRIADLWKELNLLF